MTTRVLLLTQYYPPETGAPQARLSEMARGLIRMGFEVEVLTALPSYPVGRIFEGYRGRLWAVEERDEARVVRTVAVPTRSVALGRRLVNYGSFVASSILPGALLVRRPDVIVCESPPLFLGLSALVLKKLLRARLVFNVSDLWPDSVLHMGMDPGDRAIRLARRLELLCYRASDATTGQSPTTVRELRRRAPHRPAVLIPNGCDCDLFSPDRADGGFRREWGLEDKLVVGYAGLLGAAQGVGILLEAAERTRADDGLRYVIVGDGPERESIRQDVQRRALDNVILAGHLPRERMPGVVASFDVAFIPLRHSIPGALPSKIYEAMASEVPVLLAAEGDAREIVERAEAGWVTDYGDVDGMVKAIDALAKDPEIRRSMGEKGRHYVQQHHERKVIVERMAGVVEAVARGDRRALGELAGASL